MSKKANNPRVRVLYQNLNGTWYAFTETGGNVYFGKVPVNSKTEKTTAKTKTRSADGSKSRTEDAA